MLSRRTLLRAGSALALSKLPLPAAGEETVSIVIVGSELRPLLSIAPGTGDFVGMAVDAVAIATRSLGWQTHFKAVPWARAQLMVETGEADAFCSRPTEERRRYALFTQRPLFTINNSVIHFRSDNPNAAGLRAIRSIEDLRRFSIILTIGDSWPASLFTGWTNVEMVRDDETAIRMIHAGHGDLVFLPREFAKPIDAQLDGPPLEVLGLDFLPDGEESVYHFCLRRSFPNAEALIHQLDAALATARPEIDRALKPYL